MTGLKQQREQDQARAQVDALLDYLLAGLQAAFGGKLTGLYLTGSLSYGGFEAARSDIDLQAVLAAWPNGEELAAIEALHRCADREYPVWAGRVECSYVPLELLAEIGPPARPRPWWGFDRLYYEAEAGNEWLINHYFLWHFGIALSGPEFRTLMPEPDILEVRRASARDFYREWLPKLEDQTYLDDPHQQSYLVLNLCRILHTVCGDGPGSKQAGAEWTMRRYPQWQDLIEEAQRWEYGQSMQRQADVLEMIPFTEAQLSYSGIQI